ncbi:olfactory receptor class A-like protein 1 [Protopterus annectens]|uniref:olfactory receptor class A-like protein 1 n=1 Tax=Protopterus annectens TaxID=7888 RepID=UPI001CFB2E7B|nr:olfactory receptor class A-like protein 1 [Protopterus annectens]
MSTVETVLLNLALANLLVLLSRGVPDILFVFGAGNIFSDILCKIIYFVHISFRAHALCLTCFLSTFQCVSVTATNKKWLQLKAKMQKYVLTIIIFFCVTSMASSVDLIFFSSARKNATNTENSIILGYCIEVLPSNIILDIIGYLVLARDLIFVITMSCFSFYLLAVLYQHKQKVKGIRSSDRNMESTAENQAAKTVITLVVLYTLFFGIGTAIWFYQVVSETSFSAAPVIRNFFSMCYAAFFPLVIITFNRKIQHKLNHC